MVTLSKLLADDFYFTGVTGGLATKAQFLESVKKPSGGSSTQRDHKVKIYGGSTAVIHGVLVETGPNGTTTSRFTDTWIKQADGRWLCVAAQNSPMK
ncbi:MAG: nuclear transport factor 2 family protein [Vicinamibacterales bacterium]